MVSSERASELRSESGIDRVHLMVRYIIKRQDAIRIEREADNVPALRRAVGKTESLASTDTI